MHHLPGRNSRLVALTRLDLNSQLDRFLHEYPLEGLRRQAQPQLKRQARHIHDRLTERDILRLILAFRVGAPKYVLAEHYGIGMKSVKKLLRQHGVKKRSRYDMPS